MTFMKINHEHLDSFCRGCLSKYDEPDYLLQYTEKNRRLFLYSTGIQVKRNDTFTFQLCRDCYMDMKVSCRFKKQCRTSDRMFKSFLRLKEVGEGTDFDAFLKSSQNVVKFPLSGNSTPVNQKKDEDNESICTSIRNFMTDILQGEEMPDTEARIIKEVIEEEADILEDSLDSHWLHDDTPVDDRLDFSFSPYVTPRSVNNEQCCTPIRQIEPSLRCKNNHAKKVLLQLPTSQYIVEDHEKIIEPNRSIVGNNDDYKQESQVEQNVLTEVAISDDVGMKFTTEDSIAELIEQNEDFLIRDVSNDVNVKRIALNALEIKSEIEKLGKQNEAMENIVSNITETESQTNSNKFPLTETDIAVKSINLSSFENNAENNSYKLSHSESEMAVEGIDLNRFHNETRLSKDKYNLIETNRAIKSICIENEDEATLSENYSAVKRINICDFKTESDDNLLQLQSIDATDKSNTMNKDEISIKNIINELPDTENDIEVKNITAKALDTTYEIKETQLLTPENFIAVKSVDFINDEFVNNKNQTNLSKDDIAVKSITLDPNDTGSEFQRSKTDDEVKPINNNLIKKENINENYEINELLEEIIDSNINHEHERDPLLINNDEIEDLNQHAKQCIVDTIDKNLEKALKNQSNTEFSLDDLLVSPTGVHTPVGLVTPIRDTPTGMSTPTIQYLLFGEEIKEEGNLSQIKTEEVDVLEEFFKEGVKDFEPKSPKSELLLELKYDLQNAQCYMCNRTFGTPRALKVHLNKVHGIKFPRKRMGRVPGMCKHCGKIIDDVRNLARHVRIHNEKLNEEFKCEWCHTTFLSEAKFKVHLRAHEKVKTVKEEPVTKKYLCVECGAGFTSPSNLAMHKRRHTNNYSDICKVCNKGFHRASDLDIHFKRRHSGERPHKCIQCGKAFAAKYALLEHIRKHTDQLPYQCHYCDKKFARKQEIIHHVHKSKKCLKSRENKPQGRRVRVPRFRCPYCPLAFSTKFNLVRHQNTSACWDIIKTRFEEPVKEVQITFENTTPKDLPVLIEE